MADSIQQTSNKPSPPTPKGMGKTFGQSGTIVLNGIITQEEYNVTLRNKIKAIEVFDTMRRSDSTVRSTLQVCKLPILACQWDIEPASDDANDQEIADFIERELFHRNVNFHDFMREALTMFDFGHSVAEKTYELTDFEGKPRIGIASLGFRKQRSITAWETIDKKPGITQQLLQDTVSIPLAKLIIFTNDKEGDNYEGVSLLRYAYKHWDIKDKLDIVNAIALEKSAIGVPILKHPSAPDAGDLERARQAMRNFRGNEEGYQELPEGWSVEMLDMKATTTSDVLPTIEHHDRQIQLSVLAQFLNLGASDASGSRAVSETQKDLFMLSEEAVAKNIQATIQQQLVKQLVDLNYSEVPNGYPKITFSRIGDEDTTALSTNVATLLKAGALSYDADMEEYLRKLLRLPEMPEEMEAEKQKPTNTASKTKQEIDDELGDKNVEASAIAAAKKARQKLIDVVQG